MILYVALIAVLNLALGYGLAVMMGAKLPKPALSGGDDLEYADSSDIE
jgi:hypothetical protein